MSTSEVLNRGDLVAVRFACHQISPKRTLNADVLSAILGASVTLPKGIDALLNQQVLDRKVLNPFGAIDKSLRDFMGGISVSTELGYIIDPGKVSEVSAKLAEAQKKYEEELPKLLAVYPAACERHEEKIKTELADKVWLPILLNAVRDSRPTLEEVEQSVTMEFFLFHIGQLDDKFDEAAERAVQSGVVSLRKDLPGMAAKEVAKMYDELNVDLGKRTTDRIRQSTVEVALKGASKLSAVAFLDNRIARMAAQVETALKIYQRADSLTGADRDGFKALVERLSSQRHLVRCLELDIDPTVGVSATAGQGTLHLPQATQPSVASPIQALTPASAVPASGSTPVRPASLPVVPAAPPAIKPALTPMVGVAAALPGGLFG